jgi:hypothetical protein
MASDRGPDERTLVGKADGAADERKGAAWCGTPGIAVIRHILGVKPVTFCAMQIFLSTISDGTMLHVPAQSTELSLIVCRSIGDRRASRQPWTYASASVETFAASAMKKG